MKLWPPIISGYATFMNGTTLLTLDDIVQYIDLNEPYFDISLWIFNDEQEVVAVIKIKSNSSALTSPGYKGFCKSP